MVWYMAATVLLPKPFVLLFILDAFSLFFTVAELTRPQPGGTRQRSGRSGRSEGGGGVKYSWRADQAHVNVRQVISRKSCRRERERESLGERHFKSSDKTQPPKATTHGAWRLNNRIILLPPHIISCPYKSLWLVCSLIFVPANLSVFCQELFLNTSLRIMLHSHAQMLNILHSSVNVVKVDSKCTFK